MSLEQTWNSDGTKGARVKMRLRRGSADYRSSQHVIDRLVRNQEQQQELAGAAIEAACDTFCCLSQKTQEQKQKIQPHRKCGLYAAIVAQMAQRLATASAAVRHANAA